ATFVLDQLSEPKIDLETDWPEQVNGKVLERIRPAEKNTIRSRTTAGKKHRLKDRDLQTTGENRNNGNTEHWFLRQFNRFFDDHDTPPGDEK
ncbi:MAG: hypothetical protein AB7D05_02775, partial [Mangrovibacterium sp.]